jgi:hypothetical protein
MLTGSMPAITPAQIGAVLTFVVSQAVAFGWLDPGKGQTYVAIGGIVVSAAWKIADAYLRGQRAVAVAANPGAFPGTPAAPAAPVNRT